MATLLSLTNEALAELGKLPVEAITNSQASQSLASAIETAHAELLTVYSWPWAIVYRADNTPLVNNFSPDYSYSYQLPADYGQFFKWATTGAQWPYYAFMDGMLLANTRPVSYYYIVNDANFELISPLYNRMLVLCAASRRALVLTENIQLTAYLQQQFMAAKHNAIRQADMQRSVMAQPYNDFDRITFV